MTQERSPSSAIRTADDAAAIHEVLDAFARALYDRDAAGAIATLASDAVAFDLAPPLMLSPAAMHDPSGLEQWFATWKGPIVSEGLDPTIVVGGDVACAYGLRHMTGTKIDGEEVDLWFRATACFRREHGRWRITHMHNSVPFAMDGSDRALLDLKP
jgi:ketosteroid isomerase-like protein